MQNVVAGGTTKLGIMQKSMLLARRATIRISVTVLTTKRVKLSVQIANIKLLKELFLLALRGILKQTVLTP